MKLLIRFAGWARRFCEKHRSMLKTLYYDITEALILAAAAGMMTGVLYLWIFSW